MSSRTSPCPATLLAKTASIAGALTLVPMIEQGPAPTVASASAWRAQGNVCASKAQARKSSRQTLSFSRAAVGMSLSRLAAIVDAMRTESGALRVLGASASATKLDIETSRTSFWSTVIHRHGYTRRLDFAFEAERSAGRSPTRRIV